MAWPLSELLPLQGEEQDLGPGFATGREDER